MQPKVAPAVASARQNFYSRIDERNYAALWTVLSDIITPEPKSGCVPYMWRFAEAKDYILEAGNLITAAEAERRVLILENPGLRGKRQGLTIGQWRRSNPPSACAGQPRSRP